MLNFRTSILLSFFICFCHSLSAQSDFVLEKEVAYDKYMDLVKPKASVQGGACFGDYLFVGHDRNVFMDVYDMSTRVYVCSMTMQTPEPRSRCHANTINFGNQYYKKGDEFPLLYVSSGYSISKDKGWSNVYVYRINRRTICEDSIVFSSELVQTISIMGSSWSECITDNEHNAIWINYEGNHKSSFLKYSVPDVRQKNYQIKPHQMPALDTIITKKYKVLKHNQGLLCHDGNFYCPFGVPSWREEPYLSIIDLEKKDYAYIINLYDLEMFNRNNLKDNTWEPEFFFTYKGDYFIGYRSAVYKLNMEMVKMANYFYNINCR